jgi:hypothetical protein
VPRLLRLENLRPLQVLKSACIPLFKQCKTNIWSDAHPVSLLCIQYQPLQARMHAFCCM